MKRVLAFVAGLGALCVLAGCANTFTETHFDRTPDAAVGAAAVANQPDRATVMFFRQRLPLQAMSIATVPPLYFAVDGRLVSIMPAGAFVPLSLEPGRHMFTAIDADKDLITGKLRRFDVTLDIDAGKTYYVGARLTLSGLTFGAASADAGAEAVRDAELAKLLHAPRSVDEFIRRIEGPAKVQAASTGMTTAPVRPSQSAASLVPSAKQMGEFLEVVAIVALVALAIVGGAAASVDRSTPPEMPAVRSRPAATANDWPVKRPATAALVAGATDPRGAAAELRTSSGSALQWQSSAGEESVLNLSTGVRYRTEGDRIIGSDGSRFRVSGSNVYSDTGQSYRVTGNTLYTSDGRTCTKTGIVVSCK